MKEYIVYSNGLKLGSIRAGSFKSAEKKAKKKYPRFAIHLVGNDNFDDFPSGHKKFNKHSRKRTKDEWLMQ